MAIREYVGARYVPRFMGTYDPTTQYEALDVVDNGSGTSYIARKIVPAGTPLTDTTYWFVYGASSGAIIQIQNDLIAVENDITNNIKPDILQNSNDITNIQSDVTEIKNELAGVDRTIITITDSYGYHPSAAQSWQSLLEASKPESTFYNYYEGSMGIFHVGSNGHDAEGLLTSHYGDIPDPDEITDIIFGLGINDYADTLSNVSNAYDSLIAYCNTTYPNAKLWFGFVGFTHALNKAGYANYRNLIQLMTDKCAANGCGFMANLEYIMHNIKNNEADLIHPSLAGSQCISEGVKMWLEGGEYHYRASSLSTVTAGGNIVNDAMLQSIDDGISSIQMVNVNNPNTLTFSGSAFLNFGTISDPIIRNTTAMQYVSIFSSDANAPAAMTLLTSGSDIKLSWPKTGSHSISGCQVNSFYMVGSTLEM